MRMEKPAVLILRKAVALLLLSIMVAVLAACSGAAGDPKTELAQAQGSDAADGPQTEANGAALGESSLSVAAVVPVGSTAAPGTGGLGQQPVNPESSPAALTPSGALPASAAIAPEQIVAAFEDVLHGIYENALSSVVYIRVRNPDGEELLRMQGFPEELLWSAGSGFVWDDEGHIVTNHHVVDGVIGGTNEVTVIFADSTQATGTIVGGDPHSDLAVIKLEEGDWELRPVTLGDSSAVKVGQLAVAIGAPFGQEFTVTSGIVSAVGRNINGGGRFTVPEVIQTDSAINPGNSGGPLLDRLGQVIGINTQIISSTGNYSGVGMAVPINIARRVVPSLIADGEFNYPWIGISIRTVDPAYAEELELPEGSRGALIGTLVYGSPADKAGLLASESTVAINGVDYPAGGDIIIAIGPHEVAGSSELIALLTYQNSPGDTVTFTVLRNGERKEIEVTLGERP